MHHDDRAPTSPSTSPAPPASVRQAAEILGRLFAAFPERDQGEDAKASRVASYLMAIEGASRPALLEAERRVLRGETRGDPRFLPAPSELALLVREIDAEMRAKGIPRLPPPDLSRFDAAPVPAMVAKIDRLRGRLAGECFAQRHETPAEWRDRMIDEGRLTLAPPKPTA